MAEKALLSVNMVTPEKNVYSGTEVTLLSAPATLGRVGILPGHMPLVSTLEKGEMHLYEKSGREVRMILEKGFIQVKENQVILLTLAVSAIPGTPAP